MRRPPEREGPERSRQIVDEAKAATLKLKEDAAQIFLGYLKTLDVESQTVEFTVNANAVWVSLGCRPQYWQLPKGNGAGEM